jgi:hypothetical protein
MDIRDIPVEFWNVSRVNMLYLKDQSELAN